METPITLTLAERIKQQLERQNAQGVRRLLAKNNFADIAEVLENELTEEQLVDCFQYLEVRQASYIITHLESHLQIAVLSKLPVQLSSEIIRFLPSDDAVDILQELDNEQIKKILSEMPFDPETRSLHHLMMEAPDTAAGIMSTDYISVSVESTVGDALELIKTAEEKDFVYYCYLVDSQERLLGVVSLKQLILHPPEISVQQIAHFDIKTIKTTEDQEVAANIFRKYFNLLAMPVVDEHEVLQGIITLDDVVDIIDEESSEDIYLSSGISIEQIDEKNLLTGPMINAVKARMPWLAVTMFGQFFATLIIASYEHTMASAVIAVSFMPLLSGLSGNMGGQSETITVRGIALNLVNKENIFKKVRRELSVAIVTGLCFGVGVGLLSYFKYYNLILSCLLLVSVIASLCLASLMGMLIPYSFNRYFKQDPAGVGGPLITTLLDILTFSIFLYTITTLIHWGIKF